MIFFKSYLRFLPALLLVATAVCVFDRATAALDNDKFLVCSDPATTFGLFGARGTGTALSIFAAGWLIWGGGRLVARLAVSLTVLVSVLMTWQRLYIAETPWNAVSQHASCIITWLGATLLFAGAGRLGVGFASTSFPARGGRRQWQVSISDLLVVMTTTAILLSVTKGYLPHDLSMWRLSEDEVLWIGLHSASNLLITMIVVTCFLERRLWWQQLLISSGLTAAIAGMHVTALSRHLELPLVAIDAALAARAVHHATNFVWLLGAIVALRFAGFQLCRAAQAEAPVQARQDVTLAAIS